MAGRSNNPLAEVAAEVVASDPAMRRSVQRLVKRLIREAEHTLEWGSPADRAALMKAVVPTMLRSIQSADADAGEQAREEAYRRLLAEMRGDPGDPNPSAPAEVA